MWLNLTFYTLFGYCSLKCSTPSLPFLCCIFLSCPYCNKLKSASNDGQSSSTVCSLLTILVRAATLCRVCFTHITHFLQAQRQHNKHFLDLVIELLSIHVMFLLLKTAATLNWISPKPPWPEKTKEKLSDISSLFPPQTAADLWKVFALSVLNFLFTCIYFFRKTCSSWYWCRSLTLPFWGRTP